MFAFQKSMKIGMLSRVYITATKLKYLFIFRLTHLIVIMFSALSLLLSALLVSEHFIHSVNQQRSI